MNLNPTQQELRAREQAVNLRVLEQKHNYLEWMSFKRFLQNHPELFHSVPSLRWYCTQHKQALEQAGVLGRAQNRIVIHQERFIQYLNEHIAAKVNL